MNNLLTVLMTFAFTQLLAAQITYFNKIFESDTAHIASVTTLPIQDGYYVAGTIGTDTYHAFYLRKLGQDGTSIWLKLLDIGQELKSMVTGESLIKVDNHYMLKAAKSTIPLGNTKDFVLMKLDSTGELLWSKTYGNELHEVPNGVLATQDGGYYLYGLRRVLGEPAHFLVIKTDSEGNQQWEQTYGLDGHSVAFSAEQTQDGGFIVSGYGYHLTNGYQMYVVKTDNLGNIEWQRDYGTPENDAGTFIRQTADGGYIMIGSKKLSVSKHFYIAKLDAVGDIIWEKDYEMGEFSGTEGSFILTDNEEIISTAYHIDLGEASRTSIIKFNAVGDSLWRKPLAPYEDTNNNLRDIEQTPDGGFILAGFVYETPQSSWVVKTDSLGNTCSYVGCDSVGVVSATPIHNPNPYHISLSPNPASTQVTVAYQIPMRYPYATFVLYDLNGALVKEQILHSYRQSDTVDLSGFQAGVYVYQVVLGGRDVASGKVSIIRR